MVNPKLSVEFNSYKEIFDNSPNATLCITSDGKVVDVKPVAAKIFGYTVDEMKAFNVSALFDTGGRPLNSLLEAWQKTGYTKYEYLAVRKSGEHFPCEIISAEFIGDNDNRYVMLSLTDITERKDLEKANLELTQMTKDLLKSNERFNYVTKAINDAIWDLNLETGVIHWGEGYEKLFGYVLKQNEEGRTAWLTRIHTGDVDRIQQSLENIFTERGKIWEEEYRYFRNNRTIAFVCDKAYIIYDKDNIPVRMVGAMQDITERKRLDIERSQMIEDLLQQNKNMEQFTYIISHNLRGPVSNIMGCVEMLKDEEITIEDKKFVVDGLSHATNKLDGVIKDLHTILQLKQSLNQRMEPVNLSEIYNDVHNSLHNLIIQSNAEIKVEFGVTAFNSIRSFIYSTFLNLISNSIKYRRGNIPPLIEIKTWQNGNNLLLSFKDNGLGIDLATKEEDLFGLYKRFHFHVDGKGMGLFMVKTQIETMKGKILAKSELDKGTEFIIELPI